MYPIGLFECIFGGIIFYFLGKRCQTYNKEYIELDEIQYDNVKNLINSSGSTPPRYNEIEEVNNQNNTNNTNNTNNMDRYNVSSVSATTN